MTKDHRDVEMFVEISVIYTDLGNFVNPNKAYSAEMIFFVSWNAILSVKSFGLTLFNITGTLLSKFLCFHVNDDILNFSENWTQLPPS